MILKTIDGEVREPWETLTVDVEEQHQGAVMERLGERARRTARTSRRTDAAACVSTI